MYEFLDLGFRTILVSINEKLLDKSFCGRVVDQNLLKDLPEHVDPCGENGEFHTFVFDGPVSRKAIDFEIGEKVYRTYPSPDGSDGETGFWFCQLHPKN